MGIDFDELKSTIVSLHEMNPMLGHRGCRLSITYPEIAEMQARAIFEAAADLTKEGYDVQPEVMVPLVGNLMEIKILREKIISVADEVMNEKNQKFDYKVGTMIEVPRACLIAEKIAKEAEFFSFGTNDLTQMTYGFSRDDSGKFLPEYIEQGILAKDPFATLDLGGVGQLVKMGLEKGSSTRKDLKVGICGEHGGDPNSIDFCHKIGMDYVSCSPYRVPVAQAGSCTGSNKRGIRTGIGKYNK